MNINTIIILWVMGWSSVYALGWIPNVVYLALVAPAILYHAFFNAKVLNVRGRSHQAPTKELNVTSAETIVEEEYPPVGSDEIVVDEQFEERIELDCGGYVYLEGWREHVVPTDHVQGPVETKLVYQNDNEGYTTLRTEK